MAVLNDGRTSVDVTGTKTLAAADQGIVQNIIVDAPTFTLPAAAAGLNYRIRLGGVPITGAPAGTGTDASIGLTIALNGTDTMTGNGFTPASGKGAVVAKANMHVGDEIALLGATGTWNIEYTKGTWTRTP